MLHKMLKLLSTKGSCGTEYVGKNELERGYIQEKLSTGKWERVYVNYEWLMSLQI